MIEKSLILSEVLLTVVFIIYFGIINRRKTVRRYMLLGMVLTFYIIVYDLILNLQNLNISFWMFPLYYPFVFLLYPLIYFYLVKITKDENNRIIVRIFKYIPLIVFIINLLFYLQYSKEKIITIITQNILAVNKENPEVFQYQLIIITLFYIQLLIFLTIFVQLYLKHVKRKENLSVQTETYLPKWLFLFISSIYIYEIVYLVILLTNSFDRYEIFLEQLNNFLIIIIIGFLGIKHDELILEFELQKLHKKFAEISLKTQNIFDKDYADKVMKMLDEVIVQQELFKNAGLKLEHISKKVHIPVNTISGIINQSAKQNFSQYLNSYRINAAKEIIKQQSNIRINLEDVFQEVGFYSRSTFNRSFKTIEGITPTEYLNKHKISEL